MSTGIDCIVGLGNPGEKYSQTRHNAGFWFVDELARRYQGNFRTEGKFFGETCKVNIGGRNCWLLKPATFMNRSGRSVSALAHFYKIEPENLLLAHDELDLEPGIARLKQGGGHGGHNGLRDTASAMGSKAFYRLRLGIDHPGHRDQVTDYVLSRPSRKQQQQIETAIDAAADQIEGLLAGDYQRVMNELHRSPVSSQ